MRGTEVALSAENFLKQGDVKVEKGDYIGAKEDYDRALLINPNYADAYGKRGLICIYLQDKSEAFDNFQKAAQLFLEQGNWANYQLALGYALKIQNPATL